MTQISDEISLILPHLYISNLESSEDIQKLGANNIRANVTAMSDPKSEATRKMYNDYGIGYMFVKMDDSPSENAVQYFDSTSDFIDRYIQAGQNVLINCYAGISRSVTIAMNYILKKLYERAKQNGQNIDPEDAVNKVMDIVRRGRPIANPNPGFMSQLLVKASEYHKSGSKSNLNFIHFNRNMCDHTFKDSNGKQANVICLGNDDFDAQGNLVNFKDIVGVIFFYADFCGHCKSTKPEYVKFANMLGNSPARAFVIDGTKNRELMARINPVTWGYVVKGYPTIIGYSQGKFYSEYGHDETNPSVFRTAPDFLDFIKGLGSANIITMKA